MADWDPFAVDEPAPAATAPVAAPTSSANVADAPKGSIRIKEKEQRDIAEEVLQKIAATDPPPWLALDAAGLPDLSLHAPSCTAETWNHQDVQLILGKGIAYVILNRPEEHNTITDSSNRAFLDAVHILHGRSDIRVVVLTGRGKMFCAGQDPKWDGQPTTKQPPEVQAAGEALIDRAMATGLFKSREDAKLVPYMKGNYNFCTLPQLTIGIMNGSVMGQGFAYLCGCDVVISVEGAFISLSDVKQGSVPAMMCPYLCAKTKPAAAKQLVMMGQTLNPQEAKSLGFVNWVVPDMQAASKKVEELCAAATEMSPIALQQAKQLSMGVSGIPVTEPCMWHTIKYVNLCHDTFRQGDKQPWKDDPIAPMDPPPWV